MAQDPTATGAGKILVICDFRPVKAGSGGGMTPEQFDALSAAIANISCAGGGSGITLDETQGWFSTSVSATTGSGTFGENSETIELSCDCIVEAIRILKTFSTNTAI